MNHRLRTTVALILLSILVLSSVIEAKNPRARGVQGAYCSKSNSKLCKDHRAKLRNHGNRDIAGGHGHKAKGLSTRSKVAIGVGTMGALGLGYLAGRVMGNRQNKQAVKTQAVLSNANVNPAVSEGSPESMPQSKDIVAPESSMSGGQGGQDSMMMGEQGQVSSGSEEAGISQDQNAAPGYDEDPNSQGGGLGQSAQPGF